MVRRYFSYFLILSWVETATVILRSPDSAFIYLKNTFCCYFTSVVFSLTVEKRRRQLKLANDALLSNEYDEKI